MDIWWSKEQTSRILLSQLCEALVGKLLQIPLSLTDVSLGWCCSLNLSLPLEHTLSYKTHTYISSKFYCLWDILILLTVVCYQRGYFGQGHILTGKCHHLTDLEPSIHSPTVVKDVENKEFDRAAKDGDCTALRQCNCVTLRYISWGLWSEATPLSWV